MQNKNIDEEKQIDLAIKELDKLSLFTINFLEMQIKYNKMQLEEVKMKKYFWFQKKKKNLQQAEIKELEKEIKKSLEKLNLLLKDYSK